MNKLELILKDKSVKVIILGTEYTIFIVDDENDPNYMKYLDAHDGGCLLKLKRIYVRGLRTIIDDEYDPYDKDDMYDRYESIKDTLRHEIIHAFFCESGLMHSSSDTIHWAVNEEMVDWFALQSPKIFNMA